MILSGREITFVMQVMTFGSSCSPSSAQYVKNLNAERFTTTHPRAVTGIVRNHYVDDFLDGMSTESDLISLAQDVKNIHLSGGFLIRIWVSNSQRVLDGLEVQAEDAEKSLNICAEVETENVLGLLWSTKDDVFKYRLKITDQNKDILMGQTVPSKRQLLSTIMQIFDPLGFLSNIMINVKLILQEVWKSGVDSKRTILEMEKPAYDLDTSTSPENLQLHVFVDGSLLAYSAVAFFRFDHEGRHHCSLIRARGKVASMKLISVPRIELMGRVTAVMRL